MGLFKSVRERGRAWLRRHLGNKHVQVEDNSRFREEHARDSSVNTDLGSRLPSNHRDSPAIQSLWDRAYETLRVNEPKLVEEYEELLSKEGEKTISASNDGPTQAIQPGDLSRNVDAQSRQAQLKAIIAMGLQRMEEKKTNYNIAGYEFNLSNQVDQTAKFVLWAKGLIGDAVNQSPEASIAWAGVCIILPLLTQPKVANEANRDGFIYVTTRMQYYTAFEPQLQRLGENPKVSSALIVEANNHITQLYQRILDFQIRSVLRFYRSSLGRYVGDVILPDDWEKMRLGIKEFEDNVDKVLIQTNQFVARQELESLNDKSGGTLEAMRQLLSVTRRGVEIREDEIKQKLSDKQKECLQLFRVTDSNKDATYEWYKDRVEARVDGTCEWFMGHKYYLKWLEQDSGPLLVSADPGCGKSVLAKYLIDHGLPRSTTICYFFFKDQDQNTSRQALCALLHQLFSQKQFLIDHATRKLDVDGRGMINSTNSLWTILGNAVQDPRAGHVIIVLDALDECAELEFQDLIQRIKDQFSDNRSGPSKLRYLLTSRPYDQIVSEFRDFLTTFPYVRIPGEEESDAISEEVNQVIKYRVEILAKEKGLSDIVKDHLAQRLLEIEHRTYLWVYLVFDYLKKESFKKTSNGVDSTIATLPKTINQAYEKILSKSKEDEPMVRKTLSIVLAARRPLTIMEMNVALNVDETTRSIDVLDLEEEGDFGSRLRSWCGLFISIHHGKIYFLHQTAREFLLSAPSPTMIQPGGHWQRSITDHEAHQVLAEVCVTYLDFLNSESIPMQESLEIGSFLDYSARYWSTHFREARVSKDASILPSTLRICDPTFSICSTWFRIYWETARTTGRMPQPLTSLFISSYLGHEVVVRLLLEKGVANLGPKDEDHGRTPLSWAAEQGHEAVVKLLLDIGADFESKDKNYSRTPLLWAAKNGHKAVVKLFLEIGADLESKDRYNRTPLLWAAGWGNEAVVELLLQKGAYFESKDTEYGQTPLLWAVKNGHEAVVKLFLEIGADPESKDRYGRTPLLWAAEQGHKAVVELLLQKGANFESKDTEYSRTPLLWAAKNGHEAVVKLLFNKGAKPSSLQ